MVIWRSPGLQIDHGTQAAADQPLDFHGATALLAGRGSRRVRSRVARGSMPYSAVIHRALGLSQAAAVFECRRHQHMSIAELHEAGCLPRISQPRAQARGTQFIGLAAAGRMGSPAADVIRLISVNAASFGF